MATSNRETIYSTEELQKQDWRNRCIIAHHKISAHKHGDSSQLSSSSQEIEELEEGLEDEEDNEDKDHNENINVDESKYDTGPSKVVPNQTT